MQMAAICYSTGIHEEGLWRRLFFRPEKLIVEVADDIFDFNGRNSERRSRRDQSDNSSRIVNGNQNFGRKKDQLASPIDDQ